MPESWFACPIQPLAEELTHDRLLRDWRTREVRVQALQQPRPPCRRLLLRPETTDLRLAEEVIAGEHLVGALSSQDHLDLPAFGQRRDYVAALFLTLDAELFDALAYDERRLL